MKRVIKYGGAVTGLEEERAIVKSIRLSRKTRNWQQAQEGALFEKEAASFLGVKHGILTNSGSSAGLLALSALELPKGSEVIIPAVTFPTIFNSILQCSLVPVVVDAKVGTYNLALEELEGALTKETKAIIVVHALGNPVDMPTLMKFAKKHNLYVIEDNCLSEGTLVKTERGDVPIEDVKVGDMALTRKGYRKVIRWLPRGEKEVITKLGITATPDHPFRTTRGLVSFDKLQPSDTLYTWNPKSKSIEETNIAAILNQSTGISASIFSVPMGGKDTYTDMFIKTPMGKSLKDFMSITKTGIHSIINEVTSLSYLLKNILNTILRNQGDSKLQSATLNLQGSSHLNGMRVEKVKNGIPNNPYEAGSQEKWLRNGVNSVIDNIKLSSRIPLSSAQRSAKVKVYDLEVEEEHEFFANNILVKNCDGWGSTINRKPVGSFGHLSITSFHAAHIVSMGVGGGVFTNNPVLAQKVRMYRDWGRQADINESKNTKHKALPEDYNPRFIYEKIGYNFQILELQAAMGRVQLKKAGKIKKARKSNFDYLYKHLSKYPDLILPKTIKGADVCWFAFPLTTTGKRAPLLRHLEAQGIETRPLFAGDITKHPAYNDSRYVMCQPLRDANIILKQSFWISLHPSLSKEDLKYIVKVFDEYYA